MNCNLCFKDVTNEFELVHFGCCLEGKCCTLCFIKISECPICRKVLPLSAQTNNMLNDLIRNQNTIKDLESQNNELEKSLCYLENLVKSKSELIKSLNLNIKFLKKNQKK